MREYNHAKIEKDWQKKWEKKKIYQVKDKVKGKKNFYQLVEFSYPSGNLHTGHWYAFSVPDIFARYKRMRGYNVLYPMGFDAFGLPAENAAIKLGADPKKWTYKQMDKMRGQLKSMGAMFDWEREIISCDPSYYKWTQYMFNQFLKKDLVYRAVTQVNWCPKDKTILANEQVADGKCDRCGADVIQKEQPQWMLRITKYADRLIDDLEKLDWPEEIKSTQKNWIGRSEGSEIDFKLVSGNETFGSVKVFTTRADTLFGVTYIVLAPENQIIKNLESSITNISEVKNYINKTKNKLELDRKQSKEKTGVEAKGIKAINPANGQEVPVWIADYVLASYGTGAVMAVPAHDERDYEFAKKYNLPIKEVVEPLFIDSSEQSKPKEGLPFVERNVVDVIVKHWKEDKYLCLKWKKVNWKTFVTGGIETGQTPEEASRMEVREESGYLDLKFVKEVSRYHSKFYHNPKNLNRFAHFHGMYFELQSDKREEMIDEEKEKHDLFWIEKENVSKFVHEESSLRIWNLLMNPDQIYTGDGILNNSGKFNGLTSEEAREKMTKEVGGKILKTYRLRDWGISRQRYWGCPIPIVYDPNGKAHPVPDKHLPWILPTDVDHTPDGTAPLARSKELLKRTEKIFGKGWKPEVETMDTFVDSSWYFYRYLDPKNKKTFADAKRRKEWMPIDLYMGGAEHTTMHLLYSRFWVKAMKDAKLASENEAYKIRRNRGLILGPDGNKMSKSKGNVIDPDEIVARLGADTVRMYLAFMGPYGITTNYPWDPNGVIGVRRFLERVWKLQYKTASSEDKISGPRVGSPDTKILSSDSASLLHKVIKKMTEDIEEYKFNTSITQMMILLNEWDKKEKILESEYKILLQLLAPFAPHITEELWMSLGEKKSIHLASWPKWDKKKVIDDTVTIAISVNGKVRSEITIEIEASEDEVKEMAQKDPKIKPWIEGKTIKKVIYVKGRLVNIVV